MRQRYIQAIALIVLMSLLAMRTRAQQPLRRTTCAREEFQLFLPLVGNWEVQWTDRIAPGKYADSTATARIETDSMGCLLVEHFAGERSGRPFTALILLGFANAEKLQRMLIDSEHGQFLTFEGMKESAIFRFEWQRDLGTRRLMLKHEYRAIQADSFVTETFLSTDSGKTWNVVQRAKYRRQP